MTFEFYCPQGHRLVGHEAHSGLESLCPLCGIAFVIPFAPTDDSTSLDEADGTPAIDPEPATHDPPATTSAEATSAETTSAAAEAPAELAAPPKLEADSPTEEPQPPPEPQIWSIPCPKGHVLETPEDMLGQYAMCPQCQVVFKLVKEESLEHRAKADEARRIRDERMGRMWLKTAIVAAIVVAAGVLGMLVYAALAM